MYAYNDQDNSRETGETKLAVLTEGSNWTNRLGATIENVESAAATEVDQMATRVLLF